MRKSITLLTCLLTCLLACLCLRAQDSLSIDKALLEEYCRAFETAGDDVRFSECDFLIGSCENPQQRQQTALWLYDRFRKSKLMGSESVAIHIFDKWFASGEVAMPDELSYLSASIFCDFNRASLTGCRAPAFSACGDDGQLQHIDPATGGKAAVIYFYSVNCAKCKVESAMLRSVLENRDEDLDFYAICTDGDRAAWEAVCKGVLNLNVAKTRVHHLWSPDDEKDWQMLYGVLQTPRLFLTGPDGTIVGRGLDSFALDKMLEEMFAPQTMEYGSQESMQFYEQLFNSYKEEYGKLEASNIVAASEHIARRTLTEAGDTLLFKQMTGDLLHYLGECPEPACRNALADFIDRQILGRPDVWTSADDSLQILGMSAILKELADRTAAGSVLPDIKVRGRVLRNGHLRAERTVRLDRLPSGTEMLILHHPMCSNCIEEMEKARSMKGVKFFCIDLARIEEWDSGVHGQLMDSFDLSWMPQILKVSGNRVIEKNCTLL